MFDNIYDAEEYILGFDVYTEMTIRGTEHYNFTGNDTYNGTDNRKLIMQVMANTNEVQTLEIRFKSNGVIEEIRLPFQYVYSFVIDTKFLYVASEMIPLENVYDICCYDCY